MPEIRSLVSISVWRCDATDSLPLAAARSRANAQRYGLRDRREYAATSALTIQPDTAVIFCPIERVLAQACFNPAKFLVVAAVLTHWLLIAHFAFHACPPKLSISWPHLSHTITVPFGILLRWLSPYRSAVRMQQSIKPFRSHTG